ncbi:MAG: HRDC domain-containing protein [Leptospiraceae bacterium]|nr:HRDC domain-containing protein [Leptospiraceae bacterium]MCK6381581.1 HRDC domain-containing protein [Leptospiraceae bacterium]NUM40724.1 HRDC domain-containing protein [Leptospiraceae bacterium]
MQINSNYNFINTKKNLEIFLAGLGSSGTLSIDTESSGYYAYFSKVCLIQITSNGKNYILDPLQGFDLSGLGEVFESKSFLKIFHSASDDIKALKKDFGFSFQNIADTLYSSKLLNMEHNSLNYLVEKYHHVKLSKTEQKSNWEKRPLQENQLTYAVLDTAYLESIWNQICSTLTRNNLIEEANSEFEKIAKEEPKLKEPNPIQWQKFPEIVHYLPIERRNILDILEFREEKAKRLNRAPFRILNNESIAKIVKNKNDKNFVIGIAGNKYGTEILKILHEPKGEPLEKIHASKDIPELSEEEEKNFQLLKMWRMKLMNIRNMDHSIAPSNKNLVLLAKTSPKTIQEIESTGLFSEWKKIRYAPSILAALNNENYDNFIKDLPILPAREK